jgi:hypothetical protein
MLVCLSTAVLVSVSVLAALPATALAGEGEPFGISSFSLQSTEPSAANETVNEPSFFDQAAGHPFALTSTVRFMTEQVGADVVPTRDPKDVLIDLPPGLLADPQAVPQCPSAQDEDCPTDTQVGVFVLHASFQGNPVTILGPIVNLTPGRDEAAELGLQTPLGTFLLSGHLARAPGGYAIALLARGLPTYGIVGMEITLWGVPAAAAHDPQRGLSCLGISANPQLSCSGGGVPSGVEPVALLTMGSSCSEAPSTVVWADSWEQPGRYVQARSTLGVPEACNRLPFSPEVEVRPETLRADAPVGVDLSIRSPQIEYASALATTPPLSNATATLPQGMSIDPAGARGLRACNATGPAGINIPTGVNPSGAPLAPEELGPGEQLGPGGEAQLAPGDCPSESIVGTAEARTPLSRRPIEGRVYLAAPGCGREGQAACGEQDALDGNLYRLYVQLGGGAEADGGILLKLQAAIQANPATGQLTLRLTELPQLPLSELNIHLFGGSGALLANPPTCGAARTSTNLEPWSAPYTPNAEPSSFYDVTGCTPPALHPEFLAGSVNVAAGAFTPFTLTVSRNDGEPYLAALALHAPPGLSAMLSSVPLCPQALASTGNCPAASRVGGSQVAVGAGSQPLYLPGSIYLTAGYDGAPYGLSIVTDALAGPLNLGVLVIGARIEIDAQTAALTITSDPLPQIVLGVPLRIQRVMLNLDRPHFIFNPTSCAEQQISATIASAQGPEAEVAEPFGLGDCASLAFKPRLTASTAARTTFAEGASLDLELTFPKAEPGAEANLAQIEIALPKQLPSRLTTLQGACLPATFDTDPAACPSSSVVGIAGAQTPMLPGRLTGPVYIVTHGHQAFPSPVVILQGNGVTLDLAGSTVIDKAGVASVAFSAIPDMPLETFELRLPQGPHSLLSTDTSLCALGRTVTVKRGSIQRVHGHTVRRTVKLRERLPATLPMSSELVAHSGAVIHPATKIAVVGCPRSKRGSSKGKP